MTRDEYINFKVEKLKRMLERDMTDRYKIKDKSRNQYLKCHCNAIEWYISDGKLICSNCCCDGYIFNEDAYLNFEKQ